VIPTRNRSDRLVATGDRADTATPAPAAAGRSVQSSQPWSDPASANAYLAGLTGYETSGLIADPSIRRITAILAALGTPNRRYPAVHITGTNGKGSTSMLTTRALRTQGLRVGSYTSPHLAEVLERIAIDENPVSTEQFADGLGQVAWASRRIGVTPSWFEAVTAAAFILFAQARVDVAVVEVGMLGRWDATNVVDSTVAVITNVGLDHTDMAGPSRAHVAMEKAGIVHPDATLVLGETDLGLLPIFAAQQPRRLLRLGPDIAATGRVVRPGGSTADLTTPWGTYGSVPIGLLGAHQCVNAALALTAAQAFLGGPIDTTAVRQAFGTARLAGRGEVLRDAGPTILLDGAHNRPAAAALLATIADHFDTTRPRVLVCAVSGIRDPAEFLSGVGAADFDLVIATEAPSPRVVPAESVARAARRHGAAISVSDPALAVRRAVAVAGGHGLVVVAGSLYLVEPARRAAAQLGVAASDSGRGARL
jgi:dihydrofolate synthase/folylpolyglutamate synthase